MEEPLVLPLPVLVIPAKAGIQLLLLPSLVIPAKARIQLLLAQQELQQANLQQGAPHAEPIPPSSPWMGCAAARSHGWRGGGAGLAGRAVRRRSDERGVGESPNVAMQGCTQTLSRNPQVAKRSGAVRAIRSVQCAMDGARPASCGWTLATCRGR